MSQSYIYYFYYKTLKKPNSERDTYINSLYKKYI